jgi:hypothetical protein
MAAPINPDKWSSTVITENEGTLYDNIRHNIDY